MSCEEKRQDFQSKLATVQQQLQDELQAIADDTELKAKEIADDFEADQDLAQGVGAAAGTVLGTVVGGPAGGVAGGIIGKAIGSLFTLEIGTKREVVVLDVPQAKMETQDFSFDLPTTVIRDTDISFDVPTVRMVTVRGPDIPEIETWWGTQCVDAGWPIGRICADVPQTRTIMKPTYYDKPEIVMETQKIVLGLPTIEMRRQEFKIDVPSIELKSTEFNADVPYIVLRFIKDAGKRTAALAAALAQQAQDASVQKQIAFRERLKAEIAPLAVAMFDCFRNELLSARTNILERFSTQASSIIGSITAMKAKGVPEDNPELLAAQRHLDDVMARQDAAIKPLDDAIAKLEATAKKSLEQFLGTSAGKSQALGGLIKSSHSQTKMGDTLSTQFKNPIGGLIGYSGKARAQGRYLTIGLNAVDPTKYNGWDGELRACENDARDIADIAKSVGCTGKSLMTKDATSTRVLEELLAAASQLDFGDLFVLGYSGHGGQVGDATAEEEDGLDETWCLFDRMLIDDELNAIWSKFKPGVRILVFSDSCHSGTVVRVAQYDAVSKVLRGVTTGQVHGKEMAPPTGGVKAIPFEKSWELYQADKNLYDSLQLVAGPANKAKIGASVILISGCQDNQLSLDGDTNGMFTGTLKKVWASGNFKGNYAAFRDEIVDLMPPSQTPNYFLTGANNLGFEAQRPFTV